MIKQCSLAFNKVKKYGEDSAEPLITVKEHILLMKASDMEHAYIIDYRNIAKPRTIKFNVKCTKEVKSFNLYSAILPSNENELQVKKHR